jgi:hypothetical protein
LEAQQLATKVAQLEARVATLEDEGKIVKGEVKQVLTEIRSAILVRDNPFEEGNNARGSGGSNVTFAPPPPPPTPAPTPAPAPAHEPAPRPHRPEPEYESPAPREPVMLRPQAPTLAALPAPDPEQEPKPAWSLLTIAGLSAWAEDAMRRVGPLRLEILLDLCEAAGHLTTDARVALSRITELEMTDPERPPTTNDTVVILRQLNALVNDDEDAPAGAARRL